MYLRKSLSRNGRYFLSFVVGYRADGKNKQKTIENIGWLDELEKQFDDPIAHFKKIAKEKSAEHNLIKNETSIVENGPIPENSNSLNVGYVVLKRIYEQLNFKDFFKHKQSNLHIDYNLNKIFSLLIFSRILYPGSKKETFDKKNRFFEPFDFSLKDLYRSLDYFNDYKEDIQALLWNSTKNEYKRNASTSYYDCTNYYFEIDYNDTDLIDEEGNILEKGYRKRGPEKNHRPDPIVEMGLLMDSNGIPMAYNIFPGNDSEKTSLIPILKKTKAKFGIDKVIVVADRGLNTSDNIFFLAGKNDNKCQNMDGYVYGQSIRGADSEFKSWVLNQEGYQNDFVYNDQDKQETYKAMILNEDGSINHFENQPLIFRHKSRIFAKTIQIKKDGKRKVKTVVYQKQMAYFSQKYADKQKRDRQMMIDKANDLIKNPIKYNRVTSSGSAAYINNIAFDKTTGEVVEGLTLSLNQDKINEEAKYDGYYSIVTSELGMDDKKIRDTYRGLAKIEETFKVSKTNLESRPVYVWTKEHIGAHFLTCFVSLVIIRLLENRLNKKYSIDKIIESIKNYSCIHSSENKYHFYYRDEIIKEFEREFEIDLNNKLQTKKNIKNLLKY